MEREELIEAFRDLGDLNPEWRAESALERDEVFFQLARLAFTRGVWQLIGPAHDTAWIDRTLANVPEDHADPNAGGAQSLRRLLASGADPSDINALVRVKQAELAAGMLYQMTETEEIDGNTDAEGQPRTQWGLFRINPATGEPCEALESLYVEVISSDPSA